MAKFWHHSIVVAVVVDVPNRHLLVPSESGQHFGHTTWKKLEILWMKIIHQRDHFNQSPCEMQKSAQYHFEQTIFSFISICDIFLFFCNFWAWNASGSQTPELYISPPVGIWKFNFVREAWSGLGHKWKISLFMFPLWWVYRKQQQNIFTHLWLSQGSLPKIHFRVQVCKLQSTACPRVSTHHTGNCFARDQEENNYLIESLFNVRHDKAAQSNRGGRILN